MNRYLVGGIALFVATLLLGCDALAADPELLGIFSQKLDSPADPGIASYLNAPLASESSNPTEQTLKSLSALGVSFSGRAKIDRGKVIAVSYWVDDPKLKSEAAESLFKTLASQLTRQHGPGRETDVPNFEDASPVSTRVFRWQIADQVILLSMHPRSPYANLSLQRIEKAAWLADMGADESEFWKVTLQRDADQPQVQSSETRDSVAGQPPQTPAAVISPVPTETRPSPSSTIGVVETPALPVERRAVAWPWVVGILVLAAIAALIWRLRQ